MRGYRELVFEGSLPVVKAFLWGLKAGKGWATGCIFSEECGISGEGLGHKLLEKLRVEKNVTHVLVVERQAATIAEVLRGMRGALGLAIRRNRRVRRARFRYEFKAYNRQIAGRLRRLLAELPADLERMDAAENEVVRPDDPGIEGYAPEHGFEFKGHGVVQGPVDGVLQYRDRMRRNEWVKTTGISLVLG